MKNALLFILFFCPGILLACQNPEIGKEHNSNKVYYINTQKDFDKWSNFLFPEGSKVLFAAGESFAGQFILRGSGTAEKPNRAATYSKTTGEISAGWTDNKAIINGEGKVASTILLKNGAFWTINNLEVTNTNGSDEDQGDIVGIRVIAENLGLVENISIINCYVHQVNGKVGGKKTGGIHVNVLGETKKTKFTNLKIENNVVAHVGGVGISNQSSWGNITADDYYPWTNFVIRKNRVEHTGRNGIIVRYALKPLVEYNVLAYNSRFDTGHSVFNFNTVDCIVQYNEAYGNTSNNPDHIDHGGFDADYNSRGTIIQYNYSHDNNWFCGIMRKPYNTDITIRYNVSQNELLGAYLYGFPWTRGVSKVKIYNNTHYFGKGKGNRVFVAAGKERVPIETTFQNNIFYFEDPAEWGFNPDSTCLLKNNLFFNVSPKGENAVTVDPLFENPGKGRTDIDMTDPDRLAGYRLKKGSSAINSGTEPEGHPGTDFQGNAVVGKTDIGAFEF